jgi:hypothetical protein
MFQQFACEFTSRHKIWMEILLQNLP